MNDLITVYIPTYNRLNLLKRAVKSVLQQSYANFELIIVDDNSSDGTKDYLRELEAMVLKVRVYLKEENSGANVSRNIAINMARGKFITGLDDDDYFHPKRLEVLAKKYNPKYSLITSNFYNVYNTKTVRNSFVKRRINLNNLLLNNLVGNQAFMELERLKSISGFDEEILSGQDYDVWLRLVIKFGDALRISKGLYYFDHSHDLERITFSKNKLKGRRQLLEKYRSYFSKNQLQHAIDLSKGEGGFFSKDILQMSLLKRLLIYYKRFGFIYIVELIRKKFKIC